MEILDLIGALIVLGSVLIIVVGAWTWVASTHRAAVRRARARVQVHLDALAEQICDALAAADERRHAVLLERYERLRDDLAACARLRDLRRLELRARADAALWRARASAWNRSEGRHTASALSVKPLSIRSSELDLSRSNSSSDSYFHSI